MYDIRGHINDLIKSYRNNRLLLIKVHKTKSDIAKQSSMLEPLLFI